MSTPLSLMSSCIYLLTTKHPFSTTSIFYIKTQWSLLAAKLGVTIYCQGLLEKYDIRLYKKILLLFVTVGILKSLLSVLDYHFTDW